MAERRVDQEWIYTANIMSIIAEVNRNPKKRPKPFAPIDFKPKRKQTQPKPPPKEMVEVDVLRMIFCR